jgi:hypothetical protein
MDEIIQSPPAPLIVSEQQEQIIRACCLYQWLTIPDMAMILGLPTSLNYVRRLAASLAGKSDGVPGQFLYRFALTQRAGGNGLRVFVPGEASRDLLRQEQDADGFVWHSPATMQRYSYSFVSHNIAVTRLCICAALFCRDNPSYYLVETRLASDIARTPPRVSLRTDRQPPTVSVIPDCWLFIERVADGQGTALWCEVDNSTTYREAFHRRLSARTALITSEAYAEYFGTDAVLICFAVLSNETRMHTLRYWTWELLAREKREHLASRVRFATIEYLKLYEHVQTLFTKPVWLLPADRSQEHSPYVSLLPPPQDKEETDDNIAPTAD